MSFKNVDKKQISETNFPNNKGFTKFLYSNTMIKSCVCVSKEIVLHRRRRKQNTDEEESKTQTKNKAKHPTFGR